MKFQRTLEDDIKPREVFIAAMRQVAAGIAVVTTNGPAGRHSATDSTFCSVSADPTTGAVWATVPEATTNDVNRAVHAADRAFNAGPWPTMSATDRGHCLGRLTTLLADHSEDLGMTENTDTGKLLKETRWQAKYISEFFHFLQAALTKFTVKPCQSASPICLCLPIANRSV